MLVTSLSLLSLVATAVVAQVPSGIPHCAFSCLSGNYGGCSAADVSCICHNTAFIEGVTCCVLGSCDAAEVKDTISFASDLCKGAGVSSLPTANTKTCTSTGTSAATTPTTTSPTTSPAVTKSSSTTKVHPHKSAHKSKESVHSQLSAAAKSEASSAQAAASSATNANFAPAATHNLEKYGIGMAIAGLVAAL